PSRDYETQKAATNFLPEREDEAPQATRSQTQTLTTAPQVSHNWIQGYHIPFDKSPAQTQIVHTKISLSELALYTNELNRLLQIDAIEHCTHEIGEFLSPYFLRKKPNGNYRFILNLKMLNRFISPPHFKLEDNKTAQKLLHENNYLTTIDLKDAYFFIAIAESHKKCFRFKFQGKLYQFTCIPFGLNIAPWLFTKLLKPVLKSLRKEGLKIVVYVDDWLIIGNTASYREINTEKSQLEPRQTAKFLGFVYDTRDLTLSLPDDKKREITKLISHFQNTNHSKIRDFAKFVGKLIAACPAVKYGWAHVKLFEREKYLALKANNGNYEHTLTFSPQLEPEFKWWLSHVLHSKNSFKSKVYEKEIFSDASTTGWGAYCDNKKAHGFWSMGELKLHINTLELIAAYKALTTFADQLNNCDILLRIDNTTAIATINRMGSIRHKNLNAVSREIWQWCENHNNSVHASYIKSCENIEADRESRRAPPETEYQLSPKAFNTIKKAFGEPQIDLFAINRALQKIISDGGHGILVAPLWPGQPWYPSFIRCLKGKPIIFEPEKHLLLTPFRKPHPMWQRITLVAGKF
ncbi:hypothetical protein NQ315_014652, partial [Exocentrus adspersus]